MDRCVPILCLKIDTVVLSMRPIDCSGVVLTLDIIWYMISQYGSLYPLTCPLSTVCLLLSGKTRTKEKTNI